MARPSRAEVFDPNEVAIAHVFNRTVRRCFLMGYDAISGKNFDHRKAWIEDYLRQFAAAFGIDLICYAIMSNHFHLILRSRPDVVATWDNREVARRWLMICPERCSADLKPLPPNEAEINSIANCPVKCQEIRKRLSNFSWWMRLLCQRVAQRANNEEKGTRKVFSGSVRCDTLDRRSVAVGVCRLCRPQSDPSRHGDNARIERPYIGSNANQSDGHPRNGSEE
jgi:hypothetical protein